MKAITKKEFKAFVRVQRLGVTNMLDVNKVMVLSGLNKEQCCNILANYGKYEEAFT